MWYIYIPSRISFRRGQRVLLRPIFCVLRPVFRIDRSTWLTLNMRTNKRECYILKMGIQAVGSSSYCFLFPLAQIFTFMQLLSTIYMGVWMYMADKRMINSNRSYMIMYTLQPQFLCSLHWHAAVKRYYLLPTSLHYKIQTNVIHTSTLTCFAFIQCSFTIQTFQLPVYGLNYVQASDFTITYNIVCAILILACSYICNNVVFMQYLWSFGV